MMDNPFLLYLSVPSGGADAPLRTKKETMRGHKSTSAFASIGINTQTASPQSIMLLKTGPRKVP